MQYCSVDLDSSLAFIDHVEFCQLWNAILPPIGLRGIKNDGKTQEDDNIYDNTIAIVGASYSYVASKSH